MNLKISYDCLKEYLPTKKSVFEVAKELSLKGMSVERINEVGQGLDGVVVGQVLSTEKHQNADKLSIAKIDIGKKTPLQIVFGQMAKIKVGDRLPVAIAPTTLPTGQKITKSNLRGVESEGMLCLDSELGISNQDRVTFFDEKVLPGTPVAKAMGLADFILDVEITSNRPDAMSVVGLAREAAAALGIKSNWQEPRPNLKITNKLPLSVEVKEPKMCSRYLGVVMTDVKVGPSPLWLQMRLLQSGLRPINNLVDITNYVLLEYGRPLHVFDYEKISGSKIIVRKAKAGEKILALDGKTYELKSHHLVIADAKVPVAIGGIMGGEESAAVENTKTIVFEAAIFDPVLIRKTVRELNLRSDSSDLFEKGLHPHSAMIGILRAIELTQQLAGGKVAGEIFDSNKKEYKPKKIKFDTAIIKKHLDIQIPLAQIKNILQSLGFSVSGTKVLTVTVPWWRAGDVVYDYDLTEEVARIYGYHNLPTHLPEGQIPIQVKNPIFAWENVAKNVLVGLGFSECYNYSMVSEKFLAKAGFATKDLIKIANPLNEDMTVMRNTLIAGILQNVADNFNNFSDFKIFELSNIYLAKGEKELPNEVLKLTGAVYTGNQKSFFAAKGVVELLLKKLAIKNYEFRPTDPKCPLWQEKAALDIYAGNKYLGQFGLLKQSLAGNFGISNSVALFDFDFSFLAELASTVKTFQPLPEFPSVVRDLAVVIDKKTSWQRLSQLLEKADVLIEEVEYLSTFTHASLGTDKMSVAFRLTFRRSDRTLKSEEVDEIIKRLVVKLEKDFGAKLR